MYTEINSEYQYVRNRKSLSSNSKHLQVKKYKHESLIPEVFRLQSAIPQIAKEEIQLCISVCRVRAENQDHEEGARERRGVQRNAESVGGMGGRGHNGRGKWKINRGHTASTSSSEHGDGFKLQAREQSKEPKEKGFKRLHE
jgi:hypothetical protein